VIDHRLKDVPEWVWKGHLIDPVDLLAIWEPNTVALLHDFTGNGHNTTDLMERLRDAVERGEINRGTNRHGKSIWWQTPDQRAATRATWQRIDEECDEPETGVAPDGWHFPRLHVNRRARDERRNFEAHFGEY
jgi:hypothetical protein